MIKVCMIFKKEWLLVNYRAAVPQPGCYGPEK
jgi:hypothetical protein